MKIVRWAEKNLLTIQLVIALIAIIVSVIPQFSKPDTPLLIPAIAAMIVEMFLVSCYIRSKFDQFEKKQITSDFLMQNDLIMKDAINAATHDIFLSGVGMSIILQNKEAITSALRRKIKVNILFASPKKDVHLFGHFREDRIGPSFDYTPIRANAEDMIKRIYSSLTPDEKKLLHVKECKGILGTLFVAIDIDEVDGFIQLDPILQGLSSPERPHIIVRANLEPNWYKRYNLYVKEIWKDADPLSLI